MEHMCCQMLVSLRQYRTNNTDHEIVKCVPCAYAWVQPRRALKPIWKGGLWEWGEW